MGDRAQVRFIDEKGRDVWFYTHWEGTHLQKTVASAIKRANDGGRLQDSEYFARIVFSEMIQDDIGDTTGFGIGHGQHGDVNRVVTIDCRNGMVTDFEGNVTGYDNFVNYHL